MEFNADSNAMTDLRDTRYELVGPLVLPSQMATSGGPSHPAAAAAAESDAASASAAAAAAPPPPPPPVETTTLPQMLTILRELCFRATFADKAVDAERVAVLSEAALCNTVEYRAEMARLFQAHEETLLPHRLPIGHTQHIAAFSRAAARGFYEREYRAERMTLFVVGDVDAGAVARLAADVFRGCERAGASKGAKRARKAAPAAAGGSGGAAGDAEAGGAAGNDAGNGDAAEDAEPAEAAADGKPASSSSATATASAAAAAAAAAPAAASAALPPLTPWPLPPLLDRYVNAETRLAHGFAAAARRPLVVAQHPLLHQLVVSLGVKLPPARAQTRSRGQLAADVLQSLVLDVFAERARALREASAEPPFASAALEDELVLEDDACYASLMVGVDMRRGDAAAPAAAPPAEAAADAAAAALPPLAHKWQGGVAAAVRLALALGRFGPEPRELALAARRVLKLHRDLVAREASADSGEQMEALVDALAHDAFSAPRDALAAVAAVLAEVTPAMARAEAASLCAFLEAAVADAAARVAAAPGVGAVAGAAASAGADADAALTAGLFTATPTLCCFVCGPGAEDSLARARPPAPPESAATKKAVRAALRAVRQKGEDVEHLAERLAGAKGGTFLRLLRGGEDGEDGEGGEGGGEAAGGSDEEEDEEDEDEEAEEEDGDDDDDGDDDGEEEEEEDGGASAGASEGEAADKGPAYTRAITAAEVLLALAHGGCGVRRAADISVPERFVAEDDVEARLRAAGAAAAGFAPVAEAFPPAVLAEYGLDAAAAAAAAATRLVDAASGAVTRRLRNGLTLTHLRTAFEPNSVVLSLVARGGYRTEGAGGLVFGGGVARYGALAAPLAAGTVALGARALAEAGLAGGLGAQAIAQACSLYGVGGFGVRADAELTAITLGVTADAAAPGGGADAGSGAGAGADAGSGASAGGADSGASDAAAAPPGRALDLAMQLLHGALFSPGLLDGSAQASAAFARAKDAFLTKLDEDARDLDGKVASALDRQAFNGHPAHCQVARAAAKRLSAAQCAEAVGRSFGPRCAGNLQLVAVGDFDAEALETLVLRYLGSLPASDPPPPAPAADGASAASAAAAASAASAAAPPSAAAVTPSHFVLPSAATPVVTLLAAAGGPAAAAAKKPRRARAKASASASASASAPAPSWPAALPAAVAPTQWVAPLPSVRAVLAGSVVAHADSEERCVVECLFSLPSSSAAELARLAAAEPPWEWGAGGDADADAGAGGAARLRTHPRFLFRVGYVLEAALSMRVYRRLRDVLGSSYDARVEAAAPHFGAAWRTLTASCTPLAAEAPRALAHLIDCVAGFLGGRDPLTRGEFEEAVQPVRASLPAQERTNGYWAAALVSLHCHGGPARLSSHRDKARFYAHLSFEDALAGAAALAAALPMPLAAHVAVGVSGGASFAAGTGAGAGGGAGGGKRGGGRAAGGAGGGGGGGGRDGAAAAARREWAAVLAGVHACDGELAAARVAVERAEI